MYRKEALSHRVARLTLVDDKLVVAASESKRAAYSRIGDGILNIAVGRDRDPMAIAQDLKRAECQARARKARLSFRAQSRPRRCEITLIRINPI